MERPDFIKLYEAELPMYEAWADFVLTYIDSKILSHAGTKNAYLEWVKIPPSQRVKQVDSLVTKAFIRKRNKYKDPYKEITDKAGIRFVVLLTSQLELLCNIVEGATSWAYSKDKEFDDWKGDDPRLFDYQSVHYIVYANRDIEHNSVIIKEGTPCEVQLRTLLQHAYAELAHDTIYKGNISASPEVRRTFAKSMALMETTDDLLCSAKELLEKATADINAWKDVISREAIKRLGDIQLIDDSKSADYLLNSVSELLKKTSMDEFLAFLEDPRYSYVSDKIKARQLGPVEFRHPFVLLVYFLAKKFRTSLPRKWQLDIEPLEGIYSDLGLQPPWATT
ncbi:MULTISPECIES: GTP pyrophosphokinase [Aeromonas]|uniref:GTP pyrophosphokinase n=1 Tax=Aeromonas TaxID=642 RepID=UPI0022550841|nr:MULTISPECIES: RelA/SpoT domain-containing protein [Aeromonas]MCX4031453.1 RelA/SpoT domain-containing protein [Aeromonas caviae]